MPNNHQAEYLINEDELACAICLNVWFNRDPRTLSCQHTFCFKCIQTHLSRVQKTCPICWQKLGRNEVKNLPRSLLQSAIRKEEKISSSRKREHDAEEYCQVPSKYCRSSSDNSVREEMLTNITIKARFRDNFSLFREYYQRKWKFCLAKDGIFKSYCNKDTFKHTIKYTSFNTSDVTYFETDIHVKYFQEINGLLYIITNIGENIFKLKWKDSHGNKLSPSIKSIHEFESDPLVPKTYTLACNEDPTNNDRLLLSSKANLIYFFINDRLKWKKKNSDNVINTCILNDGTLIIAFNNLIGTFSIRDGLCLKSVKDLRFYDNFLNIYPIFDNYFVAQGINTYSFKIFSNNLRNYNYIKMDKERVCKGTTKSNLVAFTTNNHSAIEVFKYENQLSG